MIIETLPSSYTPVKVYLSQDGGDFIPICIFEVITGSDGRSVSTSGSKCLLDLYLDTSKRVALRLGKMDPSGGYADFKDRDVTIIGNYLSDDNSFV